MAIQRINTFGIVPTTFQSEFLGELVEKSKRSRKRGYIYSLRCLEHFNFSELSYEEFQYFHSCKEVLSEEGLEYDWKIFFRSHKNPHGFLGYDYLRKFVCRESARDLATKFYREHLGLPSQPSLFSPTEIATNFFLRNESLAYAYFASSSEISKVGLCERFGFAQVSSPSTPSSLF